MALAEGQWDFYSRRVDGGGTVRVKVARETLSLLPQKAVDGARELMAYDVDHDCLALLVSGDLPVGDRGRAGQRRLRTQHYPSSLSRPVREQVLFDGYGAGRHGDDARAIHDELLSRDTGLDVVWAVHDGQAVPPDGARAVARNGRDWYEALAQSRYRVTSDLQGVHDLPSQHRQTVLQTWHGVPVTSVGLDDEHAGTRLGRGWEERLRAESARWDVVLSAGPHGREVLQRAFALGDAVRETGLPRHDLLVSPDHAAEREKRAAAVRDELGIPAGRRVVLLAPTYRPGLQVAPDRYRLDLFLDPAQLAGSLGDDHVLLVRAHPKVVDTVPQADGRTVFDASWHADGRDLLLAADVLVTDYSSVLVDFAVTGRPMVFFAPDLEHYQGHPGRLYLEPEAMPGPVVTDVADLAPAVLDHDRHTDRYADAYRDLVQTYAPVSDGRAAARAVDLLLGEGS